MARSGWMRFAFLLTVLIVSFSVVTGVSALVVDDEKVEACAREEGKARYQCCAEVLSECVSMCRNNLDCVGYCQYVNGACLEREPAD